ncbi:glycosyltransferase family 2 protein [Candidatus Pelagibacter sp.]|jgi:cellulose synthase/poly-beta-1,6-N-acetylglucosamine synthase-like glycosyltransferase|nr:glycosyltransferase family 2 protein [Candidatus Pelagibacter sp.]
MNKLVPSKKIYAVVICYNSEPVIEELYNKIDKDLFDKIYFFDDNSKDNSYEVAKKFDWHVIKNEKNLGHGGNLKKGIETAFLDGADYVLEIHGDNQYDPNSIINAKKLLENNYDLIIGSRFVDRNPYLEDGMPYLRYISNKIMSKLTSKLLSINLSEFHTGYKIFGKNFYQTIPFKNCSNNYLFSFQIILQTKYFNLKYDEISISASYDGFRASCGYFNGLIYLLNNFTEMFFYFLAKLNIFKNKTYKK